MNPIVVIAASAGALGPLREIVGALLLTSPASVFIVQHIGSHFSILPSLLARPGVILVIEQASSPVQICSLQAALLVQARSRRRCQNQHRTSSTWAL